MEPLIHYVLLDDLLREPNSLRPACGVWQDGCDWSTKRSLATCPRCRQLLEEEARARQTGAYQRGASPSRLPAS